MPRTSLASTRWCFTLNNPEPDLVDDMPWENCPGITYGICQLESAPTTGTQHLQGYVELSTKRTLSVLLEWLPGAHFECARGNAQSNIDYCSKPDRIDGPWEYGDRSACRKQGKRSDLQQLRDAVVSGLTDRELLRDDDMSRVFLRHPNVPSLVRRLTFPPRKLDEPPTVILALGSPGSGKSHHAGVLYPTAYWKPGGKWWDDYAGESSVVFDDFGGNDYPLSHLKRVLDQNNYKAEVKGSYVELQANCFYISSNKLPEHWYTSETLGSDGADALWRRVTKCLYFEETNGLRHWKEIDKSNLFREFRDHCLINGKFK